MFIMNPRIVVKKANWFFSLFGFKYDVCFEYAVERATATMRYASSCSDMHKLCETFDDAVKQVEAIKARVTRGSITNEFSQEFEDELKKRKKEL